MAVNVEYIIKLRDKFSAQIKKADGNADKLNRKVKGINRSFAGLGSTIAGLGIGVAVGIAAKKVATLGIEMEQTRVAFTTFLGDAEKANKLIAQLNEFANVTPFDNAEVIKSGRLLLAAGIPAEKITSQLKEIGDVAAGANVPITELAAIFQKATNKGKLQAEELNQFSERGIPLLDELSKMFGKNKAEVLKLGEQGKITSEVMNQAFKNMTSDGGIFFNLMEKQSKTVGGRISTLIGKLQLLGIKIGEALLPVIGKVTDVFTGLIEIVSGKMGAIGRIGEFITKIFRAAVPYILDTKNLIVAFVNRLVEFAKDNKTLERIVGIFQVIWSIVKRIITSPLFQGIVDLFLWLAGKIVSIVSTIFGVVAAISSAIADLINLNFDGLIGRAGDAYQKIVDGVKLPTIGIEEPKERHELDAQKKGLTGGTSTTGGTGSITPTTAATGNVKAGISEIKSAAPKTFNINIDKLVESLNISTTNLTETTTKIKDEVAKALLTAVTDISIISE